MTDKPKFRKTPLDPNQRGMKKAFSMVQSFAVALASRNINNNKINKPIKQLRVLSCFGNENGGGELPSCEYLQQSQVDSSKHICGGCGCGDKKSVFLVANADEYGKLDYPKLACPLQMPGFTNYVVSSSDEAEEPVTRKYYIENVDYESIQNLDVVVGKVVEKEEQTPPEEENKE